MSIAKKKRGNKRRLKNLEYFIPQGCYCYTYETRKPCPFYSIDKKQHHQSNGVCTAFNIRDSEDHMGLLWDMVKECGVNEELSKTFWKEEEHE